MTKILAEKKGFGQVALCGRCEDIHFSYGSVSFRLDKAAFVQLSSMIGQAVSHDMFSSLWREAFKSIHPREMSSIN